MTVSRWARPLRRLPRLALHHALDFILPSRCFACGGTLDLNQRQGACSLCWARLRRIAGPACRACGLPGPESTDLLGPAGGHCLECLTHGRITDGAVAAIVFDAMARRFLLRAKLGGRPELLRPMGEQLAARLTASGLHRDCDLIVAAPSHPWTDLTRGFSPAAVLAGRVASRLRIPVARGVLWIHPLGRLAAKRHGARQRQRLSAAIRSRDVPAGRTILLIDDVMTTGATVESCAVRLKARGAKRVRIGVWARTLPPGVGRSPRFPV